MTEIKYADIRNMYTDVKGLFDKRDYQGIRALIEQGEDIARIAKFPGLFSGHIDEKMGAVIASAKDSGYPIIVLEAIRWLGQRSNVSSYDYRLAIGRSQEALRKKHDSSYGGPKETGLEIDLEKANRELATAQAAYATKFEEFGGEAIFPKQREGRLASLYRVRDIIDDWRHEKRYKRSVLANLEDDREKKQAKVSSIDDSVAKERGTLASLSAESELFKMYVASVAAVEIPELAKAMQVST